jgi:hypothetical protein
LKHQKSKPEVVPDKWEDILEDIDLKYLPLEYLKSISITFEDDTVWEINLSESRKTQPEEKIEQSLDDLFSEFEGEIDNVDFQLDLEKIKKYVTRRVSYFLKHNK